MSKAGHEMRDWWRDYRSTMKDLQKVDALIHSDGWEMEERLTARYGGTWWLARRAWLKILATCGAYFVLLAVLEFGTIAVVSGYTAMSIGSWPFWFSFELHESVRDGYWSAVATGSAFILLFAGSRARMRSYALHHRDRDEEPVNGSYGLNPEGMSAAAGMGAFGTIALYLTWALFMGVDAIGFWQVLIAGWIAGHGLEGATETYADSMNVLMTGSIARNGVRRRYVQ